MVTPMIKNYYFPLGNGERELYIGGVCEDLGGHYTRAFIAPQDGGWALTVQGVKTVFIKAPAGSKVDLLQRVEIVKEHKLWRKTYRAAKIALGKIKVTGCFCREMLIP